MYSLLRITYNANQGLKLVIIRGKTEDGRPETEDRWCTQRVVVGLRPATREKRLKRRFYPRRGLTLVAPGASPGLKESKNFGGACKANIQGGGVDVRRMTNGDQQITIINLIIDN